MADEWWRGAVIYQIYPRSFQDTTGSGTGDLAGITRRLEHVAELGADAVWLSPFFTSPMADMGYDVSDHRGVDPSFGTLADFEALVGRAHDLGLKVLLDQVLSHSSVEHPFFRQSRESRTGQYADWYVWADCKPDGTPPNNWQSLFGGPAWEWEPKRRQYYFHNFLRDQPDFDFHNPLVQDWALETLDFWMNLGADGFRLDTANFYFHDAQLRDNPLDTRDMPRPTLRSYDMQFPKYSKNQPEALDFMERMRAHLADRGGVLIGEIGESHHPIERLADYTAPGRLHMGYHPEMMGLTFTPAHFRDQVERFFSLQPDGCPAWAFSNHDVPRHVSRWAAHAADTDSFAKLCAALLLSLPGSVCLYQGEELGLPVPDLAYEDLVDPEGRTFWPENPGRDGARTPIPWEAEVPHAGFTAAERAWLPVRPDHAARAVDLQNKEQNSVLSFYRTMLAFRRKRMPTSQVAVQFLDSPDGTLAFEKAGFIHVFNLTPRPQRIPLDSNGPVEIGNGVTPQTDGLDLEANGFAIVRPAS